MDETVGLLDEAVQLNLTTLTEPEPIPSTSWSSQVPSMSRSDSPFIQSATKDASIPVVSVALFCHFHLALCLFLLFSLSFCLVPVRFT